ncbi:hypothetical protein ACFOMH_06720 [Paracoccus mangrovi]|uniref:Uncharacterized protein n=1 Tax=Paracoccus mangrovi TaxID=1715645 RepID=A0ABV7R6M4_9RHOB
MLKSTVCAGLFLPCLVLPALAQGMPRYDVEKYCQEVAGVSGGSAAILNGCMDMEQEAYNILKPDWGGLPARSRSYCDDVAQVSGGSYSILKGCMDMETEASDAPRTFQY